MATDLMLPSGMAPSNLHLRSSVKTRYVEGDMFDICERLAEVSPRLYIVELTDEDDMNYMIMESCDDGVQRTVTPKGVKELDGRLIELVQYLLHVPFEHRMAAVERENEKYEADYADNLLEETYERMGGEFRRQLEVCGFGSRNISYPKANSPRARAGRR